MLETEFREESLVIAQKIKAHAEKKGMTRRALRGELGARERRSSPRCSPARARSSNGRSISARSRASSTDEDEALVDGLVAPGHPSTPGYNDPMYPFFGRTRAGNPVRSST